MTKPPMGYPLAPLVAALPQIQIYHWQTRSYSEHVALGGLYDELSDLVDKFIETYASGSDRQPLKFPTALPLLPYSSVESAPELLRGLIEYISTGDLNNVVVGTNTDLANIADDMVGVLNRTLYRLTLK